MLGPVQQLYLYDLPPQTVTSIKIQNAFQNYAGFSLDVQPQIIRRLNSPFFSAIASISDPEKFKIACEKMRYFLIDQNPCRALPFNREILEKARIYNKDLFVRIPKNEQIDNQKFFNIFQQYGEVISAKIAINEDYSYRNYGFVCFKEHDSAERALQNQPENFQTFKIKPKDVLQSLKKMINNIYIKNVPKEMTEQEIFELFKPFGNIKSCKLVENNIGKFGFVCYEDPQNINFEYGPECAQKAIDAMNDREMGNDLKLIVKHALKSKQREIEKQKEFIRFKNSKKRCNLYIKNFPNQWNEENIRNLFSQFGQIENIKIGQLTRQPYAFVCFQDPVSAQNAKQNLINTIYEGKQLYINFCELKEYRQFEIDKAKDKEGWEKMQAQNKGGLNWNELTQQPHLAQMLQSLLQIIQTNQNTQRQMNYAESINQRHGGQRVNYQNQRQNRQNQQYQQNPHHTNQQAQRVQNQRAPQGPAQNIQMPPPQPILPLNQTPQIPFDQLPVQQRYFIEAQKIYGAVSDKNPYLRNQVGQVIYDYIVGIAGPEKAPKITGMLIELPPHQIQQYLTSYEALYLKVQEANQHLVNSGL